MQSWALRHVTSKRLQEFVAMYFPAALSAASDWWRVTAIGVVASSQGPVDLAVFNSSYRILWCCLIFTGALASATGIQLSVALGSGNAWHAKRLAATGVSLVAPVLLSLAAVAVVIPRQIAQVFSNDPDVG
jgi:Na+-driven multidrug efflux pump